MVSWPKIQWVCFVILYKVFVIIFCRYGVCYLERRFVFHARETLV